jgi:hypothetical protein
MLKEIPEAIQNRIVRYLLEDNFPAAKALYDEWLKTNKPLPDLSAQ